MLNKNTKDVYNNITIIDIFLTEMSKLYKYIIINKSSVKKFLFGKNAYLNDQTTLKILYQIVEQASKNKYKVERIAKESYRITFEVK